MEELYKVLGLEEGAPIKKAVEAVENLKALLTSKDTIIDGLKSRVKEKDKKIEDTINGAIEIQVRDLVGKVMSETECFVGSEHIAKLQGKAKSYILAKTQEEKDAIFADMEAICYGFGERIDVNNTLSNILGDRSEETSPEARRYARAKQLVEAGTHNWEQAAAQVRKEEAKAKENEGN